ncbi:coiled-coil domain-containing protein 174 [Phlebotomus argentipes]|uniref:coiled-coil domain-containing protein 174 n=1 Tax=Phlebotomus argentipes TaxID=94469 RepID=UPI002892D2F7|nr:coiled-coil domain-containing protein 174 [Phlebotomus argentipes]
MNDPNKKIDVNISSLLSLKAELLRKQQEVNVAKEQQSIATFVPKNFPKTEKAAKSSKTERQTETTEVEDSEMMNKSKRILEAKSKFYDKMSASGGFLNSDDNCLVMFNKKRQDEKVEKGQSSSSSDDDDGEQFDEEDFRSDDPQEDWVEYTDCLGRTRKCLRKDLEFFKKKDSSLAENLQDRLANREEPKWIIDRRGEQEGKLLEEEAEKEEDEDEEEDDLLKTGRKLQQMREEWERKESENVRKEFVHYQDVLFDEARTHGVGYYQFSTDEEERAKQQKELEVQRLATLNAQKERDEQRKARDKIIKERVRAAKNRQRARMGLPPLEAEDEEKAAEEDEETLKRRQEEEEAKQRKEELEKRRDEERQQHVRPWDKEKLPEDEPKEWVYKSEREPMSQEQWVELKRQERPQEFAPIVEELPKYQNVPETNYQAEEYEEESKQLYFTSKKKPQQQFKKRNYVPEPPPESVPIRNELSDDSDDESRGKRAEIAPPATFDYYGPSSSKQQKRQPMSGMDLERSIEAGLKFLREQSSKGGNKNKWAANSDY